MVIAIHEGMEATRYARYPRAIDFSCGFQLFLPSGTRSSARRLPEVSRSNSSRNNSLICICASCGLVRRFPNLCGSLRENNEQRRQPDPMLLGRLVVGAGFGLGLVSHDE